MVRFWFLAALVTSGSAVAQQAAPVDPAPAAKPAKAERKICREAPSDTGSMMHNPPVCHTRAEWAALAAQGNGADTLRNNGQNTAFRATGN
jgi:hypothetical protein